MVAEGYEWKQLVNHYLYEGDEPLAYSLAAGCKSNIYDCKSSANSTTIIAGAALVHLATAYRFNFRDLGIEALAMASCLYSSGLASKSMASQHISSSERSTSILSVLAGFRDNTRFKSADRGPTPEALRETVISEHLDKWRFASTSEDTSHSTEDLADALKDAQIVSVLHALVCIGRANPEKSKSTATLDTSDPFAPLLFSAALRTILPQAPAGFAVPLLRQWFHLMMLTYLDYEFPDIYGKPSWDASMPNNVSLSWKAVIHSSKQDAIQPGAVQTVLALQTAAETWGDDVDLDTVIGEKHPGDQVDQGRSFWLKAAHTVVFGISQT